jgi:hypothetical protein
MDKKATRNKIGFFMSTVSGGWFSLGHAVISLEVTFVPGLCIFLSEAGFSAARADGEALPVNIPFAGNLFRHYFQLW